MKYGSYLQNDFAAVEEFRAFPSQIVPIFEKATFMILVKRVPESPRLRAESFCKEIVM